MLSGTLCIGSIHELPTAFSKTHKIEPINHNNIAIRAVQERSAWILIIAENTSELPSEILDRVDAYELFERFDGEIALLEASYNEYGFKLRLICNGNGIAPIYFHQNADFINFDWDCHRLGQSIAHKSLDFQYICRALVDPVYSFRTPFSNIQMLPPRTELIWDGSRVRLTELDAQDLVEIDLEDQDVAQFIIDHVDRHLRQRTSPDTIFAAELSGGIDSSFTTLAVFRAWETRGITIGIDIGFGPERKAQIDRRNTIVSAVKSKDFVANIREFMPTFTFSPDDVESQYLLAEEYEYAFVKLWNTARDQGCNVIVGGYGGDELFPTFTNEGARPDKLRGISEAENFNIKKLYQKIFTPRAWQALNDGFVGELNSGHLGKSARLAVIKRAPLMLSRGFWPVFPLFDEKLAAALLSTSPDQRHEKMALQDAVTKLLGNQNIFGFYEKETLEGASDNLLCSSSRKVIEDLSKSHLIEIGILRSEVIRIDSIGDLSDRSNPFSTILTLLHATEKFLRQSL